MNQQLLGGMVSAVFSSSLLLATPTTLAANIPAQLSTLTLEFNQKLDQTIV